MCVGKLKSSNKYWPHALVRGSGLVIDRVGLQLVSVGGVGVGVFFGAWVVLWVDKAHGAKKMIHQIEPY